MHSTLHPICSWVLNTLNGRLAITCAGFFPLVYWHFASLLSRPHFQFILLSPLALLYLGRTLDPEPESQPSKTADWLGHLILLAALLGGFGATILWSPWAGAICMLLAVAGVTIISMGFPRAYRYLPVWLFCWIGIPLPFGLDQELIVSLRNMTTDLASSVLDHFSIYHQRSANIIELPGKPLFIADACSGIHSLYVLMAAALFLSLVNRRTIVHSALLLIGTFALVIIENVSRIVIIAIGIGFHRDLSSGPDHSILGLILFFASLALVASIDQLLLFAVPDAPRSILGFLNSWRRYFFSSPRKAVPTGKMPLSCGAFLTVCLASMPVLMCFELVSMPHAIPSIGGFVESGFDLPPFGKDLLPAEIEGFTRTDYKTVERVFGDPFGQASQQWLFRRGNLEVVISMDYPYDGLHDLCMCYSQIGWKISRKTVRSGLDVSSVVGRGGESEAAEANLSREFYGVGYLLFSLTGKNGRTDARIKNDLRRDTKNRMADRFRSAETAPPKSEEQSPEPPFIQTQLFARSFTPLSDDDQTSLFRLFCECRRLINKKVASDSTEPELINMARPETPK